MSKTLRSSLTQCSAAISWFLLGFKAGSQWLTLLNFLWLAKPSSCALVEAVILEVLPENVVLIALQYVDLALIIVSILLCVVFASAMSEVGHCIQRWPLSPAPSARIAMPICYSLPATIWR